MLPKDYIQHGDRAHHRSQVCDICKRDGPSLAVVAPVNGKAGASHFSAVETVCPRGHHHPSKVEARVCVAIHGEYAAVGFTVYLHARLPLWALPPTDSGIPHYCNIDFCVKKKDKIVYMADAKSGRRAVGWERGRAAVEATYGIRVDERSA